MVHSRTRVCEDGRGDGSWLVLSLQRSGLALTLLPLVSRGEAQLICRVLGFQSLPTENPPPPRLSPSPDGLSFGG